MQEVHCQLMAKCSSAHFWVNVKSFVVSSDIYCSLICYNWHCVAVIGNPRNYFASVWSLFATENVEQ